MEFETKIAKIKRNLRKNLKKGALFRRYFFHTATIVLVCLSLLGSLMMIGMAAQWWNERVNSLTENAQDVVRMIEDDFKEQGITDINTGVKIVANTLDIMSNATNSDYFIAGKDGRVVLCKGCVEFGTVKNCPDHSTMLITSKYMDKALNKGFSDYATDEVFGIGQFVVAVPVRVQGNVQGAVFAVEDAVSGLLPYIWSILQTFFYAALGLLIICSIVIALLCRNITDPISEMQEVTKLFSKGEFEHRANENYDSEYLRDFAKALNKMADELANDEEAQRSFVANVSHELKTPMTTIGGFIDGILDGTIKPEQQRGYLEIVSNEIKRLSRMVVSMLNLSKIQAGEIALNPIKYDISSQIFNTLLLFEKQINEKQIEIEGLDEMGNVSANADKDLIQQVVFNLIDNAVKFTPEKGKIIVFAKNMDGSTWVRIRNTGNGVSEKEISRIFERFYKVDKSRSYDVKGVGLGLYIVKTIINMHDGDIAASSVEGQYTEFAFEIPN